VIVKLGVAQVPDGRRAFPGLTARKHHPRRLEPRALDAPSLVLPTGYAPTMDANTLAAHQTTWKRFSASKAGWTQPVN
jgi:hypothetical protein